jgi:hypothetical protein
MMKRYPLKMILMDKSYDIFILKKYINKKIDFKLTFLKDD